jgi:putative ABC transport system permease protein
VPLRLLYLYRNLTRNTRRTLLTCAAVALPITIFVLSMAVVDGFETFLENSAKQLRLAITHKTSIINPLPEGHRRKIEALDPDRRRLLSVCGIRWIGGQRPDHPLPLSTLAVDADTFVACFPEWGLTRGEIDAWDRDRQAIVVGKGTASQLGWKVGDRISILPSVPPYRRLEFHVISTAPQADDPVTLLCRRDYMDEEFKKAGAPEGLVSFFFVKCASKADLDRFRGEIDRHFAGSPDETRSLDEKTFMNEFITQQFDLPRNLRMLAALTIFVAVMAAANTMSMNFRDRINETATMRSLGFGGGFAFFLIQTESLVICLLGAAAGALAPWVAFNHTPLKDITIPVIQTMIIPFSTCGKAMAFALLIGLVAALWPGWQATRMKVVSALRNLG